MNSNRLAAGLGHIDFTAVAADGAGHRLCGLSFGRGPAAALLRGGGKTDACGIPRTLFPRTLAMNMAAGSDGITHLTEVIVRISARKASR